MNVLPILPAQDPMLRRVCSRVRRVDESTRRLLDDMTESMDAANGLGVSGPQIGKPLRLIVVRIEDELLHLVNPEIVRSSGEEVAEEGCLSLPYYYGPVARPEQVTVQGLDRNGKKIRRKANGLLARALQHEIDHLRGILFTDKLVEGAELRFAPPEPSAKRSPTPA